MTKKIKVFKNYISQGNENILRLWKSCFDFRTSVDETDTDMVFYVDYHPSSNDFRQSLDKLPEDALAHIQRHRSKLFVYTEGFDMFGQLPEIFENNVCIDGITYWKMISALQEKGIHEDQLHIWSSNYGYDSEIKMLASRKIKWIDSTYDVKAKFLYLNDYSCLHKQPNDTEKDPAKFKFLFCSLANGRPAIHRYNFTKKLFDKGLDKHGKISMVKMDGPDIHFNKKLPIVYDDKHNQWAKGTDESYLFSDVFIWISNETFLDQTNLRGYTEKTLKAIYHKTPFMINGCPGLLELLRHDGFKTFDQIWDESYDTMTNIDDRQNHILMLLGKLQHMDLKELHQRTLPIVQHNYDHLMSLDAEQKLHDFLQR